MEERIFKYLILLIAILLAFFSGVHAHSIKDSDIKKLYMAVVSYMIVLWCLNLI